MIVVVDDEAIRIKPWLRALHRAFGATQVRHYSDAADAIMAIRDGRESIDLLIWDVMMPTPRNMTEEETRWSTRTGVAVYHAFCRHHADRPAIALTNVNDEALVRTLERKNHLIARKRSTDGEALVKLVETLLDRARPSSHQPSPLADAPSHA